MALDSLDTVITKNPSTSSRVKGTPRVLVARFGNGYEQRIVDGLFPNERIWSVTWDTITLAEAYLLDQFFIAHVGLRFLWTQPKPFDVELAKAFISDNYDFSYAGGLIAGYTATLNQRAVA